MKILTANQTRQADLDCANIGLPADKLMENAGAAVAEEAGEILGGVSGKTILILVGPGNNGGDGLVAARHLHDRGAEVNIFLFSERPPDDPNLILVRERSINCVDATKETALDQLADLLPTTGAVIDAVFGIGRIRPFHGTLKKALDMINQAKRPGMRIIAVDLPSGLNADTGAVDPSCLYADNTITLAFPKIGLFKYPGAERTGRITTADIGIPAYLAEQATDELITADWVSSALPRRPLNANKGTFGKVIIVAGSSNYIGAAYLACSSAMRVGTGLVTLATAARIQSIIAGKLTEATYLPLPEAHPGIISPGAAKLIRQNLNGYDALLLGCGLGQSQPVAKFIEELLLRVKTTLPPLILDADALNILARFPNWWQRLTVDAILTPHPGEMARLAEVTVDEVQSARIEITKEMARKTNKTIVLKGACTVIATPDGRTRISAAANPGLASAGTGDVLSGIISGLAAQGLSLFDAAAAGVFLHGEAGEMVRSRLGDAGMIASDLLPVLPLAIKQLKEE
ncbi:MAG: NAD(P)H-hydrate dehydratase [Dehalococcoidales bacterium]|nr:NAD(P)H-hydrate dehydratase [Dehalococcoidales bacterium]